MKYVFDKIIIVKSSTEIYCEWDAINLKSKLNLKYILYKGKGIKKITKC